MVKGEYPETSAVVNTALGPGAQTSLGWERPSRLGEVVISVSEDAMVARTDRFTSGTLDALVACLLARQTAVARCVEALRSELTEALRGRDISDLLDDDDPSADCDVATQLMLIERVEARLWEVDEALRRVADGTYGCCVGCGAGIPLQRLRALPAAASCINCSCASPQRVARDLVDRDHLRSGRIRGRSPDRLGVSAAGGER